jgi:hypothetical protein
MLFLQHGNGVNVVRTILIRGETAVYDDVQSQIGSSQLFDVCFEFGKEFVSVTIDPKSAELLSDILHSAIMDSCRKQSIFV